MPRAKGQPEFDPLSQTWVPLGQSKLARDARAKKAQQRAEAEFLARHYQLDQRGRLPESEASFKLSVKARQNRSRLMRDYPPIPEGELERLEGIIKAYGMPMLRLSSDTAAFVMRRVMLDFHSLATLRRVVRPPMFTPEELIALMQALDVRPFQLARLVDPKRYDAANAMIHRWLHGVNYPTGVTAVRVNRMIEQHVRRKVAPVSVGSATDRRRIPGRVTDEAQLSQNPKTVRRRRNKGGRGIERATNVPLSRASIEAREARARREAQDREAEEKGNRCRELP